MLHESLQIQQHLEAQDRAIEEILSKVGGARAGQGGGPGPPSPPAGV